MKASAFLSFSGSSEPAFGAFWALVSIGSGNPWWSLAVFALCVYVLAGIVEFGEDEKAEGPTGV